VTDDFGRNGPVCREADVAAPDLETVIVDLLEGQYKGPIRVVALLPKNSYRMYRPMWHMNCASAAIFSCAMCRFSCRTLWTNMKVDITTINWPSRRG
jgi:hypothetical protein